VLAAIRHGRTLDTLADLRRPDTESFIKSGDELAAMADGFDADSALAWREGIATSVELAASCSVDLEFEQYRFPGFPVPDGETPFSYLSELCWAGAKRRYHPLTSAVVKRLAHELEVIERAGLAEFFLICWDLMRFAKEQGIPAQGRGSATSSIVSYTLGISRVEPITHDLLFERFINPGRTTYPDVDIDFSSERREEVIQYIYRRYGAEHTGWCATSSRIGHGPPFERSATRWASRGRWSTGSRRRSRRTTRSWSGATSRPMAGSPSSSSGPATTCRARRGPPRRRSPRAGRPDGPAQHPHPARRQGAAVEAAAEAGGPERPATVRLAPGSEEGAEPFEDDPLAPRTAIRGGGRSDDEGGPGDSPASVAWLRAGRGTGYGVLGPPPGTVPVDPEHGQPLPAAAQDRPPRAAVDVGPSAESANSSSVARIEPEPPPEARGGRRSASATGSAGSSSARASTASRATSRSTRAGCS
jgi:hypothetical protein